MKYYFLDLPDNAFESMKRYLDLVLTDDAQDNFLAGQSAMTIPEWENLFNQLAEITSTPFIK